MLAKRIIPCLDVDQGQVVKGVRFKEIRAMGDPLAYAKRYMDQGADELMFLDITASAEGVRTRRNWLGPVADALDIPLSVGGGIRTLEDMESLLSIGVDKVSMSTAAVLNPDLINEAAKVFGSQFLVLSIDTNWVDSEWLITIKGGREQTQKRTLSWAREAVDRGIGEILLNVMDKDGTREGYALEVTDAVARAVGVPVIASGGVGSAEDIVTVFQETQVQAALAASIFHDGSTTVREVKEACQLAGIEVRPC